MRRSRFALLALLTAAALLAPAAANAQRSGSWGRFTLFFQTAQLKQDGGFSSSYSEVVGNLTVRTTETNDGGLEYAIDMRSATYPGSANRANRVSLYDAYVGFRRKGGGFGVRIGQMWLNELGGLGSLGGALVEYRERGSSALGSFRFGLFGGLEPKPFDIGYANAIRKAGAYIALDGERGRRHVLGFVTVRHDTLTERQVATMLNFVPVGTKFFLYQAAEYDLQGPGGQGHGGLNYIFANVRYAPGQVIEFQGTYHHGRSIDVRTITNDELNGKPVDPRALEGLLFESVGGRITVNLSRQVRVWGGYSQDRNNTDDRPSGRIQTGFSAMNILRTGFDFTASDFRTDRPGNTYDSWYVSLGKTFGRSVYVSADYTSSASVLQFTDSGGVTVETRPRTNRYSLSSIINVSRVLSILLTGERFMEQMQHEDRAMLGLTFRF